MREHLANLQSTGTPSHLSAQPCRFDSVVQALQLGLGNIRRRILLQVNASRSENFKREAIHSLESHSTLFSHMLLSGDASAADYSRLMPEMHGLVAALD